MMNFGETMQPNASNRYLYLVVFISGLATLGIELSASRLLGNVFGTSNIVWANVIGLILLYLTAGYFLGGWLADRSPKHTTLYIILLWAALSSAIVPLVSRPVLRIASQAVIDVQAGLVIGTFLSILVLFSIPITLLGTISPFAIRLAVTDIQSAGKISGRIYATSTFGSLIGTFLPVLILIPLIGTTRTFLVFSSSLFIVGIVGLWRHVGWRSLFHLWMPAAVLILATFMLGGRSRAAISDDFTVIYENESTYNYIQVQEHISGHRYLFLNEGQGIHSQWHPEQIVYNRTWSYFLTAPYFNIAPHSPDSVESLLVIGLAAGTIPRQHTTVYENIRMDGVEIDPTILEVGADYFQMNQEHMPNLTTYAQDGRYILNQLDQRYDVIAVDAYRPPYIPWHLTTVEFFEELSAHLTVDGVVAINVGRTPTDRRLIDALTATLEDVYPSVHAIDIPNTFNTLLIATHRPTQPDNLQANLQQLPTDAHPILRDVLASGVENIVPATASNLVFTDDHAPVEWLVDSIVLNFLLNDDLDVLR